MLYFISKSTGIDATFYMPANKTISQCEQAYFTIWSYYLDYHEQSSFLGNYWSYIETQLAFTCLESTFGNTRTMWGD